MKYLRNIKTDRKGIAIEMALLVMMVLFSFSILITTTSLLHHNKKTTSQRELENTVAVEQIASSFCKAVQGDDTGWTSRYPDYDIDVQGLTLTVKKKDSEDLLLTMTLVEEAGTYRITSWQEQ